MSTIVAISTAPGTGGIGIVRLSGKETFNILDKVFKPKNKSNSIKGYTIKYGWIMDKDNIIDEVLVSYFVEPRSYTTENMCEINSHGGIVILNKIVELCIKNGAIIAEPGEFTKRAFLNGRIDLTQAESVIDIINAKTEKEARVSVNQLQGSLSNYINDVKNDILEIISDIDASIDYPEYDIEETSNLKILNFLDIIDKKLLKLEKSFESGKILRNGLSTAIIGKPNSGKSSLLNFILNEDRAIVTDIEGTTRDSIEEYVSIRGIPIKLIDTAGIRETNDEVEKIGVSKSIKIAENSDIILAIFDSSRELDNKDFEILELIKNKNSIIILNKNDLKNKINIEILKKYNKSIVSMSMKNGSGMDDLASEIIKMFNLNNISDNSQEIIISNLRHKSLINDARKNIDKCRKSILNGMPLDIISGIIRQILIDLNDITGDNVTEDIINKIFSKFCLGK